MVPNGWMMDGPHHSRDGPHPHRYTLTTCDSITMDDGSPRIITSEHRIPTFLAWYRD
jgi:hypothetical protein